MNINDIADVAKLSFKRCGDGKKFTFDELTNCNFAPNIQTIDISAGWSLYPVARLPGQSTLEIQATSGKFEAELFAMTNGTTFEAYDEEGDTADFTIPACERCKVVVSGDTTETYTATLLHTPLAGTVYINGLKEGASADYTVSEKVVTFLAKPESDEVKIDYEYKPETDQAAMITRVDNKASAQGEATLLFPVYDDGSDCNNSGIVGYALVRIFNCRITAQPGLSGSYKSASTYDFTLSALDAHRQDGNVYEIAYFKNPKA